MAEPAGVIYLFDIFRLTVAGNKIELYRDGHLVKLDPDASRALQILVEKHPVGVKKKDLLLHIRRGAPADDNVVYTAIHDLRVALADPKEESRLISSEGGGYRFVADVKNLGTEDLHETSAAETETEIALEEEPLVESRRVEIKADELTADDRLSESISTESIAVEDTFERWMLGRGRVITRTLFACALLTVAISLKFSFWSASLAQLIVILIAITHSFFLARPQKFPPVRVYKDEDFRKAGYENQQDFERDQDIPEILARYTTYWRGLLVSWFFLYVFLTITGFKNWDVAVLIVDPNQAQHILAMNLSIFNTILNIANTFMIWLCFNVLNQRPDDRPKNQSDIRIHLIRGLVLVAITLSFVAFLFAGPIEASLRLTFTNLVTGIAAGIVMALYVGRLQSKFLGPATWLLVALYSYTAIQALFVYLHKNSLGALLLIDLALILKCLLYLYMAWLFQSGNLLFYFARVRREYGTINDQRKAFRKLLKA
ncbi:MAG TPA: winged helix-turn-helix domain-containing protein [Pyrinomonadaceae bacterium]|nr:winged helix-turn-helix domain-containing protein [Pyrinomonadaceae bacterium]